MMKRYRLNRVRVPGSVAAMMLLIGGLASPASAQVVQVTRADARHSVGFNLGYFALRGEDGRYADDVLLADQVDLALRSRPDARFEVGDFNGFTFGGEWLYGVSNFLETGVGIGYYQKQIPTLYRELVNTNGSDIEQDLKLRIIPIYATVRFLPLGRGAAVEPYIGGGVGFFNWRYSEIGEFVDGEEIFAARFIGDGTAIGGVIVAGLRIPVGDVWSAGAEVRWQKAKGDLDVQDFLTDTIDLGGLTTSFTMHFRF